MEQHHCTVETTTADPYYPGNPGYYAECDICGHLGDVSARPQQAQRAVNAHLTALGGYPI